MKKAKYYVGLKDGKREVFKSVLTPTQITHGGIYKACIGDFHTKRGATYMSNCSNCTTVLEAERKAKEIERRLTLVKACNTYNEATSPSKLRTDEEHDTQKKIAKQAIETIKKGGWKLGVDYMELSNGAWIPINHY